jgi:hypothetical protein
MKTGRFTGRHDPFRSARSSHWRLFSGRYSGTNLTKEKEGGLSRIVPAPILHKSGVSKIKQRVIGEENILLT